MNILKSLAKKALVAAALYTGKQVARKVAVKVVETVTKSRKDAAEVSK